MIEIGDYKAYRDYDEIPVLVKDYILTVADANQIEQIPLEEINSFLSGLTEYYHRRDHIKEWEDGWVLQ